MRSRLVAGFLAGLFWAAVIASGLWLLMADNSPPASGPRPFAPEDRSSVEYRLAHEREYWDDELDRQAEFADEIRRQELQDAYEHGYEDGYDAERAGG